MISRPGFRSAIALLVGSLLITTLNYQSAVAVTGSVSGYVSEGGNLTLTAPAGAVFTSVAFASYGTPNTDSTPYLISGCHASNSSTIVGNAFIGLNSATISGDNNVFGDPCGGTYKKLAVTLNYESTTTASTFNSLALSGGVTTAVYRTASTLSAEVSVASKVTFRAGGTIIAGCKNKSTSASSPFVATCSWRPSKRGNYFITANANPNSNSYTESSATPFQVMVANRVNPRS
jgi:hypothetical protein